MRQVYTPEAPCSACGAPYDVHVHHKDRNHSNNDPSNLKRLCVRCHVREHMHLRQDDAIALIASNLLSKGRPDAAIEAYRSANHTRLVMVPFQMRLFLLERAEAAAEQMGLPRQVFMRHAIGCYLALLSAQARHGTAEVERRDEKRHAWPE